MPFEHGFAGPQLLKSAGQVGGGEGDGATVVTGDGGSFGLGFLPSVGETLWRRRKESTDNGRMIIL